MTVKELIETLKTCDEKYGTPIRFMEKNAKVIALVILLGLMMISVGITVLILKFR